MFRDPFHPSFHSIDIETSGAPRFRSLGDIPAFLEASRGPSFTSSPYYAYHQRSAALQIYGTNLFAYRRPGSLFQGYIRPASGFRDPVSGTRVGYQYDPFVRDTGILFRAQSQGVFSEEGALRRFFRSAEVARRRHGTFVFAGWNPLYDASFLESAAHRYESLARYRGFFNRAGVEIQALEQPFLEFVSRYSRAHPEFAERYLRLGSGVARTSEDIRRVGGWKLENIVRVMGGLPTSAGRPGSPIGPAHDAVADVLRSQVVYERFRSALRHLRQTGDPDRALRLAGVVSSQGNAAEFLRRIYETGNFARREEESRQAAEFFSRLKPGRARAAQLSNKHLLWAAGAALSLALVFGRRPERQTQITGLSDIGFAPASRHELTEFGSGYQGLEDQNTFWSRLQKVAMVAGAVAGGFALHKHLLRTRGGYASGLFRTLRQVEDRSPFGILRTFGLSDLASSYVVPGDLSVAAEKLVYGSGRGMTRLGEHFHRLLGLSGEEMSKGLRFARTEANSPYLSLVGRPELGIRFAVRGKRTGSSFRYGRSLREEPYAAERIYASSRWERLRKRFEQIRSSQRPGTYGNIREGRDVIPITFEGEELFVQPLYAKGRRLDTFNRLMFEMAERPQRLLSEIGLGVRQGTYNKLVHVPGFGEGGLINNLLLRRVLPIYAGYTALSYLDYLTGHHGRDFLAGTPLRANMLRAELTDSVPFARDVTEFYEEVVPGPQYGPLALPAGGAFLGGAYHYLQVLKGTVGEASRKAGFRALAGRGAIIGGLLMVPFVPGMIGARDTASELRRQYSGEDLVEVRSGRFWDIGSTPFEGSRIKYFRPHWYARMRSEAETASLYGSEEEYWANHPLVSPVSWFADPYRLEKKTYYDRPYPITSPALENVPLVGHLLGPTLGSVIKPPVRMHAGEWAPDEYTLFSSRVEPKFGTGLPPAPAADLSGPWDLAGTTLTRFSDFIGLPGFLGRSAFQNLFGEADEQPRLQGSGAMTNLSRRYYEMELGALFGLSPSGNLMGYSEPFRRFIQRERGGLFVNEILNTQPSWMPGGDYMTDFRKGDPFVRIPEGYLRLPGAGYSARYPELEEIDPEDYPLLHRYRILADVAPYSTEYKRARYAMAREAERSTEAAIEFAKTEDQVRLMRESAISVDRRRFTEEVEELTGTISRATSQGLELEQYPGRTFRFSSIGYSAADLSAVVLGEHNEFTRAQVVREVDRRRQRFEELLQGQLAPGTQVRLVTGVGAAAHALDISAVVFRGGANINQLLIDEGLARTRTDLGGAESQAMYGAFGQALGSLSESLSFVGDESPFNPLRYVPTPFHTKYWQTRTPLAQYEMQEVYGSRMRRWNRPFDDFLGPYARGTVRRLTGDVTMSPQIEHRRELDTLTDMMSYLRAMRMASEDPQNAGRYTSQAARTNVGANLFGSPDFLETTLPRRDRYYFRHFLSETDPEKRQRILSVVTPQTARVLSAQWVSQDIAIARAEGRSVPDVEESGRLLTEDEVEEYRSSGSQLSYGDYLRSREIADFFSRTRFRVPDEGSIAWDPAVDFEDVKLKIVEFEGLDRHDFGLFEDRAATLWRKPWLDGVVRELTSGSEPNREALRQAIERIILEAKDKRARVRLSSAPSSVAGSRITLNIDDRMEDRTVLQELRRQPEEFR